MFDGNGNWTSDFSAQADRDNGIKILASRFDNIFIADIKESFENCLTKDGQITPIGNFNMGGQRITNLNNGVNDNDAVNMSQFNNAVHKTGDETITGNKTITGSLIIPAGTIISKQDNNLEGGEIVFQKANNDPLVQDPSIDLYNGILRFLNCNAVAVPASEAVGAAICTSGISKGANGYVRLGNGLIVQWGTLSSGKTITYSTAFTNADSYALVFNNNSTTDGYGRGDRIESKSSTSATVNGLCENPIRWLAIGF